MKQTNCKNCGGNQIVNDILPNTTLTMVCFVKIKSNPYIINVINSILH